MATMRRTAAWHAAQDEKKRREMRQLLDASAASRKPSAHVYPHLAGEGTRRAMEVGRVSRRAPKPDKPNAASRIYPNLPSDERSRS
jgi:hypothetical protein